MGASSTYGEADEMIDERDELLGTTPAPGLMPASERVTLFTDSLLVRGTIRTRQRRLSDVLNAAEASFLVLEEVTFEEFGSRAIADRASYAQINLATVLFGVADEAVEPLAEMRMVKLKQMAILNVPPFHITGFIHLPPEADLHSALQEFEGRFLPVTEATYWSERINEPRTAAPMVAVNHARAHILAPYEQRDVWEVPTTARRPTARPAAGHRPASDEAWPAVDRPQGDAVTPADRPHSVDPPGNGGSGPVDPWRDLPRSEGEGEG
ncbi:MAG: hypothetical protein ACXWPV_00510 [Candidatus Limnocylindrales bacterium]